MNFENRCKKLGIDPVEIKFNINPDVYDELMDICVERSVSSGREISLDELMRLIIDDYLFES